MKFDKFSNNGTSYLKFSERMIDQNSGFNISYLEDGAI